MYEGNASPENHLINCGYEADVIELKQAKSYWGPLS